MEKELIAMCYDVDSKIRERLENISETPAEEMPTATRDAKAVNLRNAREALQQVITILLR